MNRWVPNLFLEIHIRNVDLVKDLETRALLDKILNKIVYTLLYV